MLSVFLDIYISNKISPHRYRYRLYSGLTPIRPYLHVCPSVWPRIERLNLVDHPSIHPHPPFVSFDPPCVLPRQLASVEFWTSFPSVSPTKIKGEAERTKRGLFYLGTERFLNFFFPFFYRLRGGGGGGGGGGSRRNGHEESFLLRASRTTHFHFV